MRRRLAMLPLLAALSHGQGAGEEGRRPPSRTDPDVPASNLSFAERVHAAIERGVAWLRGAQDAKTGSWGPCVGEGAYGDPSDRTRSPCHPTGPTSFSLFTLAKCDVPREDKGVQRGLRWLRAEAAKRADPRGAEFLTTYEISSIVMMIEAIYHRSPKNTRPLRKPVRQSESPLRPPDGSPIPRDDWKWLHDCVARLTEDGGHQKRNGGWRYWAGNDDEDLSATQFALLGLRSATMAGYPLEKTAPGAWARALDCVRRLQSADGSFRYRPDDSWTIGMDACGLGALVICREQLRLAKREVPSWVEESLAKGFAHLDANFSVDANFAADRSRHTYHYYYLYSIERLGDLTGRREFGGRDWYVRGAELLLAGQREDGCFPDIDCMEPQDTLGTCFALLFLKRATVPTVTVTAD